MQTVYPSDLNQKDKEDGNTQKERNIPESPVASPKKSYSERPRNDSNDLQSKRRK